MCTWFQSLAWIAVLATGVSAAAPQPTPLPEPDLPAVPFVHSPFSNDRTVALLKAMLDNGQFNDDPVLRERIVADLARTRNYTAVPHVVARLDDPDWRVRVAAANGLGDVPRLWVREHLTAPLSQTDGRVVAAGVRAIVRHKYTSAAGALAALIDRDEERLSALAIDALTDLGLAREQTDLCEDLAHAGNLVPLAALNNAPRVGKPSPALVTALKTLAGDPAVVPMLRGKALAVLGLLTGAAGRDVLLSAAGDADWRVRLGVAEAMGYVGPEPITVELLADPVGPVRLAAIRSVQRVRDSAALDALWERLDDPIEVNRLAAREALVHIPHPQVAIRAARRLRENGKVLLDMSLPRRLSYEQWPKLGDTEPKRSAREKAIAASYILGKLKSRGAHDFHLKLLEELTESDPLVAMVALSLGRIDDDRAGPAMVEWLEHAYETGLKYYRQVEAMQIPTLAFDEVVYADVIRGLGMADPAAGTDMFEKTVLIYPKLRSMKMVRATLAVLEVILARSEAFEAPYLDAMLGNVIDERTYSDRGIWQAAYVVGKLKFKGPSCEAALRHMLDVDRRSREFLLVAGWALQRTTGEMPTLPNPVAHDPPGLTLRDIGRD